MPKHETMAPKAIANRQKSVGLQKLKWYCQMCEKQCRDENGFKCHTMSEGHLRQMKLFSDNSGSILDEFSREFEHGYLQALSHLHGTKRVLANRVYQEYIADKHHVHMNATIWTSLAGFCKHLGKDGKAIVDETEKGWYIQYIDRDPKVLARQKDMEERKRSELDDDERSRRLIETQIKISQQSTNDDVPIPEDEQDTKIEQNVGLVFNSGISLKRKIPSLFEADDDGDDSVEEDLDKNSKGSHLKMKYAGTFAEISASKDESADITACPKLWLHKGIIVKVLSNVDSDFVNMKGEVESISLEPPGAVVKFTDKLKYFSQDKLQTVVPKVGECGLILKGVHRGFVVKVLAVNRNEYNCSVVAQIDGKDTKDIWLVEYEDFSKLESS